MNETCMDKTDTQDNVELTLELPRRLVDQMLRLSGQDGAPVGEWVLQPLADFTREKLKDDYQRQWEKEQETGLRKQAELMRNDAFTDTDRHDSTFLSFLNHIPMAEDERALRRLQDKVVKKLRRTPPRGRGNAR